MQKDNNDPSTKELLKTSQTPHDEGTAQIVTKAIVAVVVAVPGVVMLTMHAMHPEAAPDSIRRGLLEGGTAIASLLLAVGVVASDRIIPLLLTIRKLLPWTTRR
jgi:hypothetical protein